MGWGVSDMKCSGADEVAGNSIVNSTILYFELCKKEIHRIIFRFNNISDIKYTLGLKF